MRPATEGRHTVAPEPALGLPKGRTSRVSARRNPSIPGETTRSRSVTVERAPPPTAFDLGLQLRWREKAPGRARLQPRRQSPTSMRASAPEVGCLHPGIQLPPLSFRHANEANKEEPAVCRRSSRKLSSTAPIVLYARVCARVASCRHKIKAVERNLDGLFLCREHVEQ